MHGDINALPSTVVTRGVRISALEADSFGGPLRIFTCQTSFRKPEKEAPDKDIKYSETCGRSNMSKVADMEVTNRISRANVAPRSMVYSGGHCCTGMGGGAGREILVRVLSGPSSGSSGGGAKATPPVSSSCAVGARPIVSKNRFCTYRRRRACRGSCNRPFRNHRLSGSCSRSLWKVMSHSCVQ